MRTVLVIAALAMLVWAALAVRASTAATIDFTKEQAQRGQFVFAQNCARCHNSDLSGRFAPALSGSGANLRFKTLGFVYSYMTAQMPMGNAGSLSDEDYAAVMAFLLQANGVHPDAKALIPAKAVKSQVVIGTAQ